jgi:sporulation protein YlmC with PRC-barrel domain
MDVARDLLDKQVVDRNGREMGRVDGIIVEQREGGPPRLSTILIGASVLGERVHPAIGRWVAAVERALGLDNARPVPIAFNDIAEIDRRVKVDVAIGDTAAGAVERWVRGWVTRIPGGR